MADLIALSELESQIIISLATGGTQGSTALALGIPVESIAALLKRKGVQEYLKELKAARKEQMVTYAAESVFEILQDKRALAVDEGIRPADTTRKDTIDVARQLVEILKTSDTSTAQQKEDDVFTKLYLQINNIQQGQTQTAIDVTPE